MDQPGEDFVLNALTTRPIPTPYLPVAVRLGDGVAATSHIINIIYTTYLLQIKTNKQTNNYLFLTIQLLIAFLPLMIHWTCDHFYSCVLKCVRLQSIAVVWPATSSARRFTAHHLTANTIQLCSTCGGCRWRRNGWFGDTICYLRICSSSREAVHLSNRVAKTCATLALTHWVHSFKSISLGCDPYSF